LKVANTTNGCNREAVQDAIIRDLMKLETAARASRQEALKALGRNDR